MDTVKSKVISRMIDFGESFDRQSSTYGSDFVKKMIESGGVYLSPDSGITYQIPAHFGFCYGVEKSIDMAFETTRRFPDRRIFLTHDVIHNDRVNQDLLGLGVKVLARDEHNELILDQISQNDIVVIAAFGSKFHDVKALEPKGCVVVDTTCGAIVMVWKRVEKYAKNGHTSIIHGIWDHEETQATASQAVKFKGHFLIIRDLKEARYIEMFLKKQISADDFMKVFKDRSSEGFDPEACLGRIGIASQTTMLKTETLQIQEYLKNLYKEIYGEPDLSKCFMVYDTICSATQERQDALELLLENQQDLMIVIGGFNSSNTIHLYEIASRKVPGFHIRGPEDILSPHKIRHLCSDTLKEIETTDWMPNSVSRIGIATGASTPDALIEKVISRLEECRK